MIDRFCQTALKQRHLVVSRSSRHRYGFQFSPPLYRLSRTAATYRSDIAQESAQVMFTRPTSTPSGIVRSGLERLPTSSLLRNILLSTVFSLPIFYKPSFTILRKIANSRSRILSPDYNPLLRIILKPLLYNQFCAGTNQREIFQTRDGIKGMGFSGIILCYGKEMQLSKSNQLQSTGRAESNVADREIKHFENGNLETLDMVGGGDWLGIKLSGAGSVVTGALLKNEKPPAEFIEAMHKICQKAAANDCRLWIDGEQQALQAGIDKVTIDLMRTYNRDGRVVVYNTLQAYLKAARDKLKYQLALADKEGWTLAVKLVRGAYIDNDIRERIHNTKQETDDSHNGLIRSILSGTDLGFEENKFPKTALFLAGHNPESVGLAWDLTQSLHREGRLKVVPDFGQLQGMGDVLGCSVVQRCEDLMAQQSKHVIVPRVYKCLTWGSIQECMQYLFRRVVENSGGTDRIKDGLGAYIGELKRRWTTFG